MHFRLGVWVWAVTLSAVMMASGCSDSDYVVAPSVPLEDVPQELSSAFCDALERCHPTLFAALGDQCVPFATEQSKAGSFDQIVRAVEEERVTYDPKAAADCIEASRNLECDNLDNPSLPACEDAFQGSVARGGECTVDEECEGNDVCVLGSSCPGTCEQRLTAGQNCGGDDHRCGTGLSCSEVTHRCIEPAALGDECDEEGTECASPLFCKIADGETVGECARQEEVLVRDEGESCNFLRTELCKTGLSCVLTGVENEMLQFECRTAAASGEACGVGVPGQCSAGEYCAGINAQLLDLEGTCEALPGDGEPCADAGFGEAGVCILGTFCDGDTCRSLRDNGQSCNDGADCWSENCIDGGCAPSSGCQ